MPRFTRLSSGGQRMSSAAPTGRLNGFCPKPSNVPNAPRGEPPQVIKKTVLKMERRRIIGIILLALAGVACLVSVVWNLIRMPEGADARIRAVVCMLVEVALLLPAAWAALEWEGPGIYAESHRPRRLPLHYARFGSFDPRRYNQYLCSPKSGMGSVRKLVFHNCHPRILHCCNSVDVLVNV